MKFIFFLLIVISSSAAVGQRTAVDRNTGRILSCDELGCTDVDTTYENTDRNCLDCLIRLSDSTMQAEKDKIIEKCKSLKKECKSFIKDQNVWQSKCEKIAVKESNKYKGGTMEVTEYVRTKLILTNKRTAYLKKYFDTLDNP